LIEEEEEEEEEEEGGGGGGGARTERPGEERKNLIGLKL